MTFTQEHKDILEKYREHWDSLRTVQFMRNIDRPVFDALQRVHNEAIGIQWFSPWCPSCVADMVRILYTQYEKSLQADDGPAAPDVEPKLNRKQRRHGQVPG